jgi:hypothetical protein
MAKKLYGAAAAAHAKKTGRSKRRKSTAIVHHTRTITRTARAKPARRRRRGGSGGGVKLTHLALASAGLAFITGQSSPVAFVRDNAAKIPGAKTFGTSAALGVACLAIDRFVKPNKWLKLMGTAGIVLAAVKLGDQGTGFKWLGDEESGAYDLEDVGDDDMGDDDVGDDE